MSELLGGKKEPSDIVLSLLEARLGVSADWLRTGVGDMILPSDLIEESLEHSLIKEEQTEYKFTLDIHGQIAEHNVAIIKRLIKKMLYIFL